MRVSTLRNGYGRHGMGQMEWVVDDDLVHEREVEGMEE